MSTRAIVQVPERLRRGVAFQVRTLLSHPMESGHRADGRGGRVPRDIVRRMEARLDDGRLVFAADLHAAVAANPFVAFWLSVSGSGTLALSWTGDNGFAHREMVALVVGD